jgi:PleD family two-component response regulator
MGNTAVFIILLLIGFVVGSTVFGLLWQLERSRGSVDEFTGLQSYRSFTMALEKYRRKMLRGKFAVGLALIDIDDFRSYNNKGYAYGDEMLRIFANELLKSCGDAIICARYRHGDEFILLFEAQRQQALEDALHEMNTSGIHGNGLHFKYGMKVFEQPVPSSLQMLTEIETLLLQTKGH